MTQNLKVGDKVRVRKDLKVGKRYTMYNSREKDSFVDGMNILLGKEVTISKTHNGKYGIEETGYNWTDEMFEYIREVPPGHTELPEGCYKPFEIPRKNKTPRKIVAPDSDLLKYQRGWLPSLEKHLQDKSKQFNVNDIFHGFVPNRNCVTAAQKHIGYDLTIMMDIVAFFDSVTQEHTNIKNENLYTIEGYCGQGFATSPMLSNIGIVPAVASINEYLQQLYGDTFAFTMYADDIQISINSSDLDEYWHETNELIEVVTAVFEAYGFQIHPHKTRVRLAKYGYRRILGINVGDDHIRATRRTMKKLRAAKHQKNGPSAGGLTTWSKCLTPIKLRKS